MDLKSQIIEQCFKDIDKTHFPAIWHEKTLEAMQMYAERLNEFKSQEIAIIQEPPQIIKPKRKTSFQKQFPTPESFLERFPDWQLEKVKHYYLAAIEYSDNKGGRYIDWERAVRNWDAKHGYKSNHTNSNKSYERIQELKKHIITENPFGF